MLALIRRVWSRRSQNKLSPVRFPLGMELLEDRTTPTMFGFFRWTNRPGATGTPTFKPRLEGLEDRTVPSVIFPANNGFERPNLLSNAGFNYKYPLYGGGGVTLADQGGSGWTFTGLTGVADNGFDPFGNSFNVINATNGNHDGTKSKYGQAALIQSLFQKVFGHSLPGWHGNPTRAT